MFSTDLLDHHFQKAYLTVGYLMSELQVISSLSLFDGGLAAFKIWAKHPKSVADSVQERKISSLSFSADAFDGLLNYSYNRVMGTYRDKVNILPLVGTLSFDTNVVDSP